MRLRTQLLLIGVIVLALPLSGWQFARQVERTLRAGHAESLTSTAVTVARQLADAQNLDWPAFGGPGVHVHQPATTPFLDGYADDWAGFLGEQARAATGPVQVLLAETDQTLYLLIEVESDEQIYSRPGVPDGDRLILQFSRHDGLAGQVDLAPLAPGFIETRGRNSEGWPRVQAYWQPRSRGWTVELQLLDRHAVDALHWSVIDRHTVNGDRQAREFHADAPLRLIRTRPALSTALAAALPDQMQAWIALPSRWVIGHADRSEPRPGSDTIAPGWLDTFLFEGLASDAIDIGPDRSAETIRLDSRLTDADAIRHEWRTRASQPGVRLSVQVPIERDGQMLGSLLLERDADQLLLDSNRAILRLLGITLSVFVSVALLLLGYATWLSERIRRLRDGVDASVADDGQVRQTLTASGRRDELGDLGRSVSRLLARLREHQNYLRTLADKLAHELRTPLAMVRSSLDNLKEVDDPEAIARYRQRASEGSDRLNRIFQAMSQASRIEESLTHEDFESLDLAAFLEHYLAACRDTYAQRRFKLIRPDSGVQATVAPDLLAQLLDKLIDNAVDFSPPDGTIQLRLRTTATRIELDVDNPGPPLPANSTTLFDAMVSVRDNRTPRVHLGLGLNIVRLIAEHHRGSVSAHNIKGGVRFQLSLPRP